MMTEATSKFYLDSNIEHKANYNLSAKTTVFDSVNASLFIPGQHL